MAEEIKQENPQAADERHLDKKDVTKAWFKWICLSNTNYNYERLMASDRKSVV